LFLATADIQELNNFAPIGFGVIKIGKNELKKSGAYLLLINELYCMSIRPVGSSTLDQFII
jgi:hypothetical protein